MKKEIFSMRRMRMLASSQPRHGKPVLCWLSRALRPFMNPALDFAVETANEHGAGVWALVVADPACPRTYSRHPAFFFDGLAELAAGLRERGIPLLALAGDTVETVVAAMRKSSVLVCDEHPEPWARQLRAEIARRADIPVLAVEADALVPPLVAADHAHAAARTIRPVLHRLLPEFLPYEADREVRFPLMQAPDSESGTLLDAGHPDSIRIPGWDHSLETRARPRGGQKEARKKLAHFIETNLHHYHEMHHRADLDAASGLGPYLRCGHLGVHEIVRACEKAPGPGSEAFLEQVIVRRELSLNAAWFHPGHATEAMVPAWAVRALESRPRQRQQVSFADMEAACTPDEAWNAAMLEMKVCGTMHNYMRMYWGKQVLYWSANWKEAYQFLLQSNDRYFWDGCEPNGTVGVAWVFGLHDRPFVAREGFGVVRSMTPSGLSRKFDVDAYVRRARLRAGAV